MQRVCRGRMGGIEMTGYITNARTKCMDCGAEFERGAVEHDCYNPGEWNTGYTYEVCPQCGSDYLADGESCPQCGEWTEDELCVSCDRSLRLKIASFALSLSAAELKALDHMLDGKWFSDLAEELR